MARDGVLSFLSQALADPSFGRRFAAHPERTLDGFALDGAERALLLSLDRGRLNLHARLSRSGRERLFAFAAPATVRRVLGDGRCQALGRRYAFLHVERGLLPWPLEQVRLLRFFERELLDSGRPGHEVGIVRFERLRLQVPAPAVGAQPSEVPTPTERMRLVRHALMASLPVHIGEVLDALRSEGPPSSWPESRPTPTVFHHDGERVSAHVPSPLGATVLRHCQGLHSVGELAAVVKRDGSALAPGNDHLGRGEPPSDEAIVVELESWLELGVVEGVEVLA